MKKLISFVLLLACALSLTLALTSCNGGDAAKYGLTEADGKTYFLAEGAALVIENGNATATDASGVTDERASKVFNAPASTGDFFTYTEINGKINVTGLTESGKAQAIIILPEKINGKSIALISAGAFEGVDNLVIAKHSASMSIAKNAFKGVKNLFLATDPNLLEVGDGLFDGDSSVKVYVSQDMLSSFKEHYNWKKYASVLNGF